MKILILSCNTGEGHNSCARAISEELERKGEPFALLVLPDHPTPLAIRTHDAAPVPYLLYRSDRPVTGGPERFTEAAARAVGRHVEAGYTLLSHMLKD